MNNVEFYVCVDTYLSIDAARAEWLEGHGCHVGAQKTRRNGLHGDAAFIHETRQIRIDQYHRYYRYNLSNGNWVLEVFFE